MKKALVILLLVVIVFTGLPIMMGMAGMAMCQDCGPAVLMISCTLAILAASAAFALSLFAIRSRSRREPARLLLHSFLLERPPRLA